jgi:hypothetical protein
VHEPAGFFQRLASQSEEHYGQQAGFFTIPFSLALKHLEVEQ